MAKKLAGSKQQPRAGKARGSAGWQPPDEEIAHRAYELWLAHGATHGHDVDDWLAAESELRRARRAPPQGAA
jgi:hypothetical protein